MILIGDNLVAYEDIVNIKNIEDIKTSKANSTVSFGYNEVLKYCFENEVNCAVIVNSIKEAIYCNALNARYIIASKDLAKDIQKTAENYMFDSKVLATIETNDELEEIASFEIDGVIYNSLLN